MFAAIAMKRKAVTRSTFYLLWTKFRFSSSLEKLNYVIGPIRWKPNKVHYFFCLSDKQTALLHAHNDTKPKQIASKTPPQYIRRRNESGESIRLVAASLFWFQLHTFAADIVDAAYDVAYTIGNAIDAQNIKENHKQNTRQQNDCLFFNSIVTLVCMWDYVWTSPSVTKLLSSNRRGIE